MFRILVVDDEAIESEALRRIIEGKYGDACKVETASNGQMAVNAAQAQHTDIVLMDIEMPGINGLEAAKIIKQMLPCCRVIILTAYQRFQYAQMAIAIGTEDYLLKPVSNQELFTQIDKAMESIRKDRESDVRRSQLDQLAKEQFVLSAMSGYTNAQSMQRQLAEAGLTFSHGFFCIVKSVSHCGAEQLNRFIRPFLRDWTDMRCLTYEYDERLIMAVLMETVYQSLDEVRRIVEHTLAAVLAQFGVQLMAGIGDIATDVGDLQQSYNLANEALFRCTEQFPVQFPREGASEAKRRKGLDRKLYQYLLDKDLEGATRCVDIMLDTLFYVQQRPGSAAGVMERVLSGVAAMLSQDARESIEPISSLPPFLNTAQNQQEISIAIRNLLSCWMQEIEAQPAARIQQIREEINRYIGSHYCEDLSIKQIARDMHYSEPYFSKLFTRCFQRNFVTYLTDYRMQVAQEMLASPLTSIKEISAAVGYTDSNYFSKVFRKAYGASPSDYRRLLYTLKATEEP